MIDNKQDERVYSLIYVAFFAGFMLATIIFGIVYFYTH